MNEKKRNIDSRKIPSKTLYIGMIRPTFLKEKKSYILS